MPFGPMTSPILSTGTFSGDDPRRERRHLARRGDRVAHHAEDRHPGPAGLLQRAGQHRGGDAVELGVELQRGDHLLGARDLEVHVAERVLGAEDVGQRRRTGRPRSMRPIAMPATVSLSGTPALSSDSVEAQTEPIEVEPLELIASDTWRIA